MLKKYLSIFKIGSANIDLVLDTNEFIPGEKVSGYFKLQGGFRKQKVKRLECDLVVQNREEKSNHIIETVKTILMSRTLHSEESTEIPFTYQLPKGLQPTCDNVSYRFHTRLIFSNDIKDTDHDEIRIFN